MIKFTREHGDYVLRTTTSIPLPIDRVFPFFSAAENLERITPPALGFKIRTQTPIAMQPGALIDYTIRLHGLPLKWRTEITRWDPPHSFTDTQLRGPYTKWVHTHTFQAMEGCTLMDDEVRYRLPFGPLGRLAHVFVRKQLEQIFAHRQVAVRTHLLAAQP